MQQVRSNETAGRWDSYVAFKMDMCNVLDTPNNKKEFEECQDLNHLSL
jgi:hypothetical protein